MAVRYILAWSGLICLIAVGCASEPPAPPIPSPPLTKEQRAAWAQKVAQNASISTALAGGDGEAEYERVMLQQCLYEAQEAADASQRSAEIAQCRIDWPLRPVAPVVNTACMNYGGVIQCRTQ